MGFYGFKHKLNVGNALRETASKERATASAEYSAALRQRDNEMISCIATIAVAMDRGFSGHRNPLKDAIVQTAVASGLDGSIVTRIVNQAFASHGSEYAEMLLRGAEAFRQKPLVVREELTRNTSRPQVTTLLPLHRRQLVQCGCFRCNLLLLRLKW